MAAHRQNPADLLREYTATELEHIADGYHSGIGGRFEIPVDIDVLLENTPGVDLDIWPGLAANHSMLGMTGIDSETNRIFVYIDDKLADTSASMRRYRMTVAEELAHILIHRPAIEAVSTVEDFRFIQNHPKWYIYERNAKRLAAALLMPASSVLNDARKLYSKMIDSLPVELKHSNPEAIKGMMASLLADKYEVSVGSMSFRLNEWPINVLAKIDHAMKNKFNFLE
ncbi:MAG: ImmA/IrrE family metallo-endopeptidase [Sedimentisphaerales bacterium]